MIHHAFRLLTLPLLVALLLAPVSPAQTTIRVPKDVPTIQQAVTVSKAGDTILVSAGTYAENVVIPVGKIGLTVQGKGAVFVDGPGGAHAFLVQADRVTLSRLTVRHCQGDGVRVQPAAGGSGSPADVTLDRLAFIANGGAGVRVSGDRVVLEQCALQGNNGGIAISGDGARVLRCTVSNDVLQAVRIEGADALVERCELSSNNHSLEVLGARARISRCKVVNSGGDGILVTGADAVLEKNIVLSAGARAVLVSGDGARLLGNQVTDTADTAMTLAGDGLVVSKNTIARVHGGSDGLAVNGSGVLIEKNRLTDVEDQGFVLVVSDSTVRGNTGQRLGNNDIAMNVVGDDNEVSGNTLRECSRKGIRLRGDRNLLLKNKLLSNTDDGIDVDLSSSEDNVLEGNQFKGNHGEGLVNGGVDTVIRKNSFKGNRQDVANRTFEGANLIDEGGNTFQSGGLDVPPAID